MTKLFCSVRKVWVQATPEEQVRQDLLTQMVANLGYPLSSIALEKELNQLPHLSFSGREIPQRRADLICFAKDIHPKHALYPLLLIECKAIDLSRKVIDQVVGYNQIVQSYFICVANAKERKTGWYDIMSKNYSFVNHLPSYKELLQKLWSPPTTPESSSYR